MNNTLLIKGRGFYVGLLFALVEMKLPSKAKHTSLRPRWWQRHLYHELRVQNVTPEEYVVMRSEFCKISPHLRYEFF
jgi:hypothetical protein